MKLLLALFFIQALTVSEIKEDDLAEGERVHISGYLTQISEDQAYLSSTPNLKTCCIPKTPGFWVQGAFPQNIDSKAVVIEGIASHSTTVAPKLSIQQGKVISIKEEHNVWLYALLGSTLLGSFILWRRKRKT